MRDSGREHYIWFMNRPATTRINIEQDGTSVGLTFESNALDHIGKPVGFLVADVRLVEEYARNVRPILDRAGWLRMSLAEVGELASFAGS